MVMQCLSLGFALEDLFNYCQRSFSIKTVSMIAIQLLYSLKYLHNHHFIHRNLHAPLSLFLFFTPRWRHSPPFFHFWPVSPLAKTKKKEKVWTHMNTHDLLISADRNRHDIYLTAFGYSKRWRDPRTLKHIRFIEKGKRLVGTSRYASRNAHKGMECSRRDDLLALGYILMYFLKGNSRLPWSGLRFVFNFFLLPRGSPRSLALSYLSFDPWHLLKRA